MPRRKPHTDRSLFVQYALVLLVFMFMVMISNYFAGNIVNKNLHAYGEEVIGASAETLSSYLKGHQDTFEDVVHVVEDLYSNGASSNTIAEEMVRWTSRLRDDKNRYGGFLFIYGFIDGELIQNMPRLDPAAYTFELAQTRPWYIGAYEYEGQTFISDPYFGIHTSDHLVSLSKVLYDDTGEAFGVLAFDIYLSTIAEFIKNMHFMDKGYGVLVDSDLRFIVHHNPAAFDPETGIGYRMDEIEEYQINKTVLMREHNLNAYKYTSLAGEESVMFSRKLFNGWHLYIASPRSEFYSDVNVMFAVLSLAGLLATLVLCSILTFMHRAKTRSDKETVEYKKLTEKIKRSNNLTAMVNYTSETLLTTDTDESIETLLMKSFENIGIYMDVDRVQIWKNEMTDGDLHFVHRYEWLSETGKQKEPIPIGLKFPYSSKPEWESLFMRGECINGPISQMASEDQILLNAYSMKTIVIIPLFLKEEFWGFFSIDDCKQERVFSDDEISALRSASLMLASSLLRDNMNIEIQEALEEAKAASIAKSDFLSNMSHEIRTPMNAVIGMAELLLYEDLNERQKNYVSDIHVSGQSLLSIINDILDMSKIEAGKLELNPVNYNLDVLLDHISSMFKYIAGKKGVEFKFEYDENLPKTLFGDDIRLKQVLTNICGNAVKFTEKGYVRLKVSKINEKLHFEIKDTGKGIKKEDMSKLFNAFSQVDTHKNRSVVGTGLGLAISKSFIEMMGGVISFDSEYGEGTVFTIIIPIVAGKEEEVRREVKKEEKLIISAPDAKVLVVDDNTFNLKVVSGLLGLSKINPIMVTSGKQCIEAVRKKDFDIIFMDHMMPEMDGVEATAEIRKLGGKYESLIIIALTANAVHGAKEMYLANGFNDFISKPVNINELVNILEKWLPPEKLGLKAEAELQSSALEDDFLTALGHIMEIDTKLGLSRIAGMEDMYKITVELFYNNLTAECKNMTALLNDENIRDFATAVHAMKSMLSTIGAMGLSGAALDLELAAKKDEADFCHKNFPALLEKLNKFHKDLSAVFKN